MKIRPTHVVVSEVCEACKGAGVVQHGRLMRTCEFCEQGHVMDSISLEEFAKLFTWRSQQTKDTEGNWGTDNVLCVAEKRST